MMITVFRFSVLFFTCSIFVQCDYFNPKPISAQQIEKQSNWSKNDHPPSFPICEELQKEERFDCFKKHIVSSIEDFISQENLTSTELIDDTVSLNLIINKKGNILLKKIIINNAVKEAIPSLSSILKNAVKSLPKASPAIKTNVGVFVHTQLLVPIKITTTTN